MVSDDTFHKYVRLRKNKGTLLLLFMTILAEKKMCYAHVQATGSILVCLSFKQQQTHGVVMHFLSQYL